MERSRPARPSAERPKTALGGRPSPLGTTTTAEGAELTDLGCPDCPGVLALLRTENQMSFVCSVGHAFSSESLIEAKETWHG